MGKTKLSGLLLFVLLFSASSVFCSEKIVNITTLYDYPPFCFKEEGKTGPMDEFIPPLKDATFLKGYSWDVVRESYHAMGYTIHLKIAPWNRGMKLYIEKGRVDLIFPATKTQKRLEKFHFSHYPTDSQKFVIYTLPDFELEWKGLESLKGLRIGMMLGWSYGDKFDTADYFKKMPISVVESALKNLAAGRYDGMVGYELSFDYVLKKEGLLQKFKKLPPFDKSDEFIIGLKSNPVVEDLLKEFDLGKEIIMKNGVLDKINERWLKNETAK